MRLFKARKSGDIHSLPSNTVVAADTGTICTLSSADNNDHHPVAAAAPLAPATVVATDSADGRKGHSNNSIITISGGSSSSANGPASPNGSSTSNSSSIMHRNNNHYAATAVSLNACSSLSGSGSVGGSAATSGNFIKNVLGTKWLPIEPHHQQQPPLPSHHKSMHLQSQHQQQTTTRSLLVQQQQQQPVQHHHQQQVLLAGAHPHSIGGYGSIHGATASGGLIGRNGRFVLNTIEDMKVCNICRNVEYVVLNLSKLMCCTIRKCDRQFVFYFSRALLIKTMLSNLINQNTWSCSRRCTLNIIVGQLENFQMSSTCLHTIAAV